MLLNGKKQHHLQKKNNAGQQRQIILIIQMMMMMKMKIQTNGTTTDIYANQKSSIQNLDLLSMIEKINGETRLCTDK